MLVDRLWAACAFAGRFFVCICPIHWLQQLSDLLSRRRFTSRVLTGEVAVQRNSGALVWKQGLVASFSRAVRPIDCAQPVSERWLADQLVRACQGVLDRRCLIAWNDRVTFGKCRHKAARAQDGIG